MYLVTSEQMRCFDHSTIEEHKVPGIVLMDHAGKAIAQIVSERGPKLVGIVCGKGNNGGDGWTAARWLCHFGIEVYVLTIVDPVSELSGDAKTAFEMAAALGIPWRVYENGSLRQRDSDVYVDALLGTGCTRALGGRYKDLVEELNDTGVPVVAADVPSGVNASTGEVYSVAVQAAQTVAMGYEKLGTAVTPGAICAGRVHVADIGVTASLPEVRAEYVHPSLFKAKWGKRDPVSHKGTYGKCGIYVGQMQGAALLSAAGALRAGAGLIVLGMHQPFSLAVPPDYVVRVADNPLMELKTCTAVVIGPGLGQTLQPHLEESFRAQLREMRGVIDADGLRMVGQKGNLTHVGDNWVLTPHPKECGMLLGWTTEEVQAKRVEAATTLAAKTGAIVLLKGHRTLIADPAGRLRINPTGDGSLSVGGTGDVLSGVIGSLMGQGLSPFDSASLGAWLHGRAGELAGAALTPISTSASDIANDISRAIMTYLDT